MSDSLRRLFGKRVAPNPTTVRPVSDALDVEPGEPGGPLRDAVAAIDRVHQDGVLPVIPLSRASFRDRHGQCSLQKGKIAIKVNLVGPHVELTTVLASWTDGVPLSKKAAISSGLGRSYP